MIYFIKIYTKLQCVKAFLIDNLVSQK